MRVDARKLRVLDLDLENRPLSYLGQDFTTAEITAIAYQFIGYPKTMSCWVLGEDDPRFILEVFIKAYALADIVTAHNIRGHDLTIINGSLLEHSMPPLGPKLVSDTYRDLKKRKGLSVSQENLGASLGLKAPKFRMNQAQWREANRLTPEGIALTRKRVVADVRQHIELRAKLIELGWLGPPKQWRP